MIRDPLTHIVRNSADHGLEMPAERRAKGKPDHGTIRLSAYHESGQIVIQIADDGRVLNTARIREKAIAQGLMSEGDKLSEAQIHKFIFASAFPPPPPSPAFPAAASAWTWSRPISTGSAVRST